MTDETREQLQRIADELDEMLDQDDLTDAEFHDLNAAYHAIEGVLEGE